MPMTPTRANIALTVDGGGIRGLLVAQALKALEAELGNQPLITSKKIKVLAGTSTGTLVAGGIALGMTAAEIADMYVQTAKAIFVKPFGSNLPPFLDAMLRNLIGLLRSSLYSAEPLKQLVRQIIKDKTGDPDLTIGGLRARLRDDQALIITVSNIYDRRTEFLKTYMDNDQDWTLWEAVLATAAAPTYFPPLKRGDLFYTDGTIGSFGNPAAIAARELIEWQGYEPKDITVFSFGTGWIDKELYRQRYGDPNTWNALRWARNGPFMIVDDATRAQSLDIINDFIYQQPPGLGMDYRRFQLALPEVIPLDQADDAALVKLRQLGDQLGQRIVNDQHALGMDPNFDPEGIRRALERAQRGKIEARS
jgi:uncharacterized protein